MKASTIVILVVVGIALAIAGYLYFGDGGLLVGLITLLPAGKNLLATTKHAGKVEQATDDREKAQGERDQSKANLKQAGEKVKDAASSIKDKLT